MPIPNYSEAIDKTLSLAPVWLVRAIALILVPVCLGLLWEYRKELIRAERSESENKMLHEQVEDLKITLGTERAKVYYKENQ